MQRCHSRCMKEEWMDGSGELWSPLMEIQLMTHHHDSWCSIQRTTKKHWKWLCLTLPINAILAKKKKEEITESEWNLISEISTREILPVSSTLHVVGGCLGYSVLQRAVRQEGTPAGPKISFGGQGETDVVFRSSFHGLQHYQEPHCHCHCSAGHFWSQG